MSSSQSTAAPVLRQRMSQADRRVVAGTMVGTTIEWYDFFIFAQAANKLNWVSLDPPLIETFAIISRDPASLSPATQAMIKLAEEHMRMLHREYQPA